MKEISFPIKADDVVLLRERANYINHANAEIKRLKTSLLNYLKYTFDDKGDNRKTLFEIPFEAVTFHDLADKEGYENGTWVNFDVLGIHTIRVNYLEGALSGQNGAFAKLKIEFLCDNLRRRRTSESGGYEPYHSNFNDDNLCFGDTYVFQTKKQYEAFKDIYNELKLLAQNLGMYL